MRHRRDHSPRRPAAGACLVAVAVIVAATTAAATPPPPVPPPLPSGSPSPLLPGGSGFFQGYQAPTGPILPSQSILAAARAAAKNAGDASPTGIAAVLTTVGQAATTMAPNAALPTAPNPGYAAYLASAAYLVVIHGHFILSGASYPSGGAPPKGTVLELVVDAHTGRVGGTSLTSTWPTTLAQLGHVTVWHFASKARRPVKRTKHASSHR